MFLTVEAPVSGLQTLDGSVSIIDPVHAACP
jgi:hypothetical protein